jgi:predicted transcriptional regulator
MEEALSHIGRFRKQLGITQNGLAKRSGVSQSLIAKI